MQILSNISLTDSGSFSAATLSRQMLEVGEAEQPFVWIFCDKADQDLVGASTEASVQALPRDGFVE